MKTSCPLCNSHQIAPIRNRDKFELSYCEKCKFIFLRNNFDYKEHYNQNYFDNYHNPQSLLDPNLKITGKFSYLDKEEVHLETYRTIYNLLKRFIKIPGSKSLDVGAAGGSGLKVARDFGSSPVGVDVSPEAVVICKSRGFEVYLGELKDVSEEGFDIATLHDVLEHMQYPHESISHLYRIMRPGGIVFVKNNLFSLESFQNDADYFNRQFEPPYHCSYFSEKLLLELFAQHDFSLVYSKPTWVNILFNAYGSLKRRLRPDLQWAFEENKRHRLDPAKVAKVSQGSRMGQLLNEMFPSGFVFKKINIT